MPCEGGLAALVTKWVWGVVVVSMPLWKPEEKPWMIFREDQLSAHQ